jgi:peptide/nickel transport system substrate-binding protein
LPIHRLRRPAFYLTLLLLAAIGLLTACRPDPSPSAPVLSPPPAPSPTASEAGPSPSPHPPAASPTPLAATPIPTFTPTPTPLPRGGRVVEVGLADDATLNPLLAADDDDLARAVGGLLFDSLLRVNPQTAALLPGLARDWQVSADGQTFTFHLRSGVTWHDGRPFSAADVTFTLAAAGDPEGPSPYRFDLANVIQTTAPDDETVIVTFDRPGCDALYAVGRVPILPRHLLAGQNLAEAAFNRQPVGTGPFVFEAREVGSSLALKANDDYWAGRPYLDGWTYRLAPDAIALQKDLRPGQVHLARLPDDFEITSLPMAFHVLAYPAGRWHFLALNNDHPILGDATVRRALALALDRERLLAVALEGQGALMDAPWLANHWALDGMPLTSPAYAPDQASQLLAEAGWRDSDGDGFLDRDGEPLYLHISANLGHAARERIAILVQQYWQAVGIAAQVEVLPWGVFLDDLFSHVFEIAVFDWPLEPGPDQTWLWATAENMPGNGFNFVSYASARADALLERGRTAPGCDPARRAAAYRDLARQLAADQPYVFLFAANRRLAVSEALIGPQPGPYGGLYWNVADWYLTESEAP